LQEKPGITDNDIAILQRGSRDFDLRTQDPSQAYMHSMARDGEGTASALYARNQFIEERIAAARASLTSDETGYQALLLLAEALHPIMDSSSPEHMQNGQCKVWLGWRTPRRSARHSPEILGLEFWGHEQQEALTPEILKSQDKLIYDAWLRVFGK
jgi:hypothetical protein